MHYKTTTLGVVRAAPVLKAHLLSDLTGGYSSDMFAVLSDASINYVDECPVLLAYQDEQVIGWAVMYWAMASKKYLDVFVAEESRGRGIARHMLLVLKKKAGKGASVSVDTHPVYAKVWGQGHKIGKGITIYRFEAK